MFKKWICFILILILGLTCIPESAVTTGAFDFGDNTAATESVPLSGSGTGHLENKDGFTSMLSAVQAASAEADATVGAYSSADIQVINAQGILYRQAMVTRKENFTLNFTLSNSITDSNVIINSIFEVAFQETGKGNEGDYIGFNWSYCKWICNWTPSGSNIQWSIDFTVTHRTNASQENQVTTALNSLYTSLGLSGISSPYKRLLRIYDYITQNITYDYEHLPQEENYPLQYTAYAALINKTAVCQGYSLLLYRMLTDNNVPVRCITGDAYGDRHMWNIVKIGGIYYNCDSTWDTGVSTYKYLLRGENYFSTEHHRHDEFKQGEFLTTYATSKTDYNGNAPTPTPTPRPKATATPRPTATPTPKPTVTPHASVSYPTAKLLSKTTQTVKRGKTVKFKFKLKSGSFKKTDSIYRAEFDLRVYNSNGTRVAWNGADGYFFTGTLKHTLKWKVPKDLSPGKYTVNFRTYYNKQTSYYDWYYNKKTTNSNCYIIIK